MPGGLWVESILEQRVVEDMQSIATGGDLAAAGEVGVALSRHADALAATDFQVAGFAGREGSSWTTPS